MSTPSPKPEKAPKPASKAQMLHEFRWLQEQLADPTNDLASIRHWVELAVVAALDPVRAQRERVAREVERERTRPAREAQMLKWFGVEKCATFGIFPPAPAAPAADAPEPAPVPE